MAALIPVFLIILMIVLHLLMATFKMLVAAMPYVTGFVGTLIFTLIYPSIKELIPGHPKLSVFSVAVLVELVIFLLLSFEQTSRPTIIFTSSLFINCAVLIIFCCITIDSWQLGIFCTIVYLVGTAVLLMTNLDSQETTRYTKRNIILSIFAGLLYAMSVGITFLVLLGFIWEPYIKTLGNDVFYERYDTISLYVMIAAMVITFIVSVIKNLIEQHYVTVDFIPVEDLDEIQ